MGTGGGERLSRLQPLGIPVVQDEGAPDNTGQTGHDRGRLPFRDGVFGLVASRCTTRGWPWQRHFLLVLPSRRRYVVHSNPDVAPAPRRWISGTSWEKSMTVVGSVPQSPESITASRAWPS